MTFRLFRAFIWAVCVLRAFFPSLDPYLGICPFLNQPVLIAFGIVLLTAGFASVLSINLAFGERWRSGIDPDAPKVLISSGIYRFSRNPMFLGVAISQFGFFLALPSVFTFICLVIGFLMLHRQTLSEEQHLQQVLLSDYTAYCSRVPRWL